MSVVSTVVLFCHAGYWGWAFWPAGLATSVRYSFNRRARRKEWKWLSRPRLIATWC